MWFRNLFDYLASTPSRAPAGRARRVGLAVTNPNAAGIDVGADEHWVCVPAETAA